VISTARRKLQRLLVLFLYSWQAQNESKIHPLGSKKKVVSPGLDFLLKTSINISQNQNSW